MGKLGWQRRVGVLIPSGSEKTKIKGYFGEAQVVSWLQQQGYTVLWQNYTWRAGEIDIIARKGETVSFIEVKTRMTTYFDLSELITQSKQKKIIHTAKKYIAAHGSASFSYQFDVALVEKLTTGLFSINYISNAFYGVEFY